ncbi:KAP-like P-loop domain-containing protein [Vibrio crassostreae]|uniref:KAP family P-loop NTPase fold protein n=1 Tax=Vibrio crassostreae TaxID=246167 RepID=UPI0010517E8B|nr:P-loop NTPase fold protein [Vibrio crassostreae]TCT43830.1 KAP-like P-loop domain-containing protein [Vibrio crassostreae]
MAKAINRYEGWKNKYSFEDCELENEQYGNYLSSYLRSQKKPLVLNLNGTWGTGKTHFLKQIYSDLRFKHGYPVIYIDSWKSDFSNDPLLVIISEMIEQFKELNLGINAADKEDKLFQVVAKYSKKLWNATAVGAGTYASGVTDNSAMIELSKLVMIEDKEAVTIGRNLSENYKNQLSALTDTKKALQHYLECFDKDKRKVFVLVDELDRCRPTYAIEMLETIKHFFSIDNYVFVVATDTKQLSHSIQAVYGSSFDGTEYLSRFFNRSAALPEPDKKLFATLLVKDTALNERAEDMVFLGLPSHTTQDISILLYQVSVMYNLSLRRMEQVFNKFESCVLYELDTERRYYDVRLLIQLIAEYDSLELRPCYDLRKKSKGQHCTVSKQHSESMGVSSTGGLSVEQVIFNKSGSNFKLSDEDELTASDIRRFYSFSWEFVNGFSNDPNVTTIDLKYARDVIQEQLDENGRLRHNNMGADEHKRIGRLNYYKSQINEQIGKDSENELRGLWTRNDYFQAVELSARLTIELSKTNE